MGWIGQKISERMGVGTKESKSSKRPENKDKTDGKGGAVGVSEEELSIFGLTDVETKIVRGLLELGPTGVSKLSRETGLPHTTIHSAIRRIEGQGLVRRISSGYRSVWKVVKVEKIQKLFGKALESFDESDLGDEMEGGEYAGVGLPQTTEFSTVKGQEDMLGIYHWFFLNNRNKTVYSVLTHVSCETLYSEPKVEIMTQLSELMRQNSVRIEEIQPESVRSIYRSHMAKNKGFRDPMGGCRGKTYLVSEVLLSPNTDIKIVKDAVLITNWGTETLILIKNSETISVFQNMFNLLKNTGKEFNQDTYLHELFEESDKT